MLLEATVLTGQNIFIECDYNFLSCTFLINIQNNCLHWHWNTRSYQTQCITSINCTNEVISFKDQLHSQTNAHNSKCHTLSLSNLLHVSAPRCHPEGVTSTNECKQQNTDVGSTMYCTKFADVQQAKTM